MTAKLLATFGLSLVIAAAFVVVRDGGRGRSRFPPAMSFRAASLKGGPVGIDDFRGRVVLVNFWATYCLPCVEEMPSLERIWRERRADGLVVLAVSIDDDVEDVRRFQQEHGLSFPIAHDAGKAISAGYGTEKVPETYVISRSGEVRAKVMGAVDWTAPENRSLVAGLLAEAR